MDFAGLVPFIPTAVLVFAAGIVGFFLGQAIERVSKDRDRIRIDAFKANFHLDAQRLQTMATSIKNKADEIYTELDRAEKTIASGRSTPLD